MREEMFALLLVLAAGCVPEGRPSYVDEVQPIFNSKCLGRECHVGAVPAAEGLELGSDLSYASIVGVPSRQNPGRTLVVPGSAASSYLFCKIVPGCGPIFGERMPIDEDVNDLIKANLTAEEIDIIRRWIDGGALDDQVLSAPFEDQEAP